MKTRLGQYLRLGVFLGMVICALGIAPNNAYAAPYAALVMDARSGKVLHSRNADTRLHPASLTKMMTLYITFEAIRNGELTLDTPIKISRNAANEEPSKLGLRAGQRIKLRYLIRAASVKSANDAATALAEAISGSEAAFARRMNRTAKAMGMTRTTFKNAHGLTETGHMSTARDMSILGRHLFYDYPDYYNLFSRMTTDAGVRSVTNTNRRLLSAYKGADGIKTGYTRAAGFNLVASAERGGVRIIATVFGGRSSVTRNAKVAELLDLGFSRAPTRVAVRQPARPSYQGNGGNTVVAAAASEGNLPAGKTIRLVTAVSRSLRPILRPDRSSPVAVPVPETQPQGMLAGIEEAVREAQETPHDEAALKPPPVKPLVDAGAKDTEDGGEPPVNPTLLAAQEPPNDDNLVLVAVAPEPRRAEQEPVIVTRISSQGDTQWGVNVGLYGSRYQAERVLLKTALKETSMLEGTLRKAQKTSRGFEANFLGMSREAAEMACQRLEARRAKCSVISPS